MGERLSKMKQRPKSVSEILASGQEGRMFTSAADGAERGATRPVNPDQAIDATVTEMGRAFYGNEVQKEAAAAAAAPLPAWAEPVSDAQVFYNVDEMFPTEAAFNQWC